MSYPLRREQLIMGVQLSPGAVIVTDRHGGVVVRVLFIGGDWAEDHHDVELVDAVKLLARAHQNAIWERPRLVLRLRSTLREYFAAAIEEFADLSATDTLSLLERAPSPALAVAARLTRAQLTAALRAARRHHVDAKAATLQEVLRAPALRHPPAVESASSASSPSPASRRRFRVTVQWYCQPGAVGVGRGVRPSWIVGRSRGVRLGCTPNPLDRRRMACGRSFIAGCG